MVHESPRPWHRFVPWLGLLAIGIFLHVRELLGGHLFVRDSVRMFVPAKHFLFETLRRGELPEWWPFDAAGSPFIAQPLYSFFHPTTLFYALLPFWTAFTLQDLVGTLLALFGAYLLARALGQPRTSAFVAASLFGGCGYLVCITEFTFTKLSAGALPWYAWALLIAERRRGAWLVAPPLALALVILGGEPQVAMMTVACGAVLLWATEGLSRWTVGLAVLSPMIAGALSACQLLPSALIVPETERAAGLSLVEKWPLNWQHVLGFMVPLRQDPQQELISSTYMGLAGVVLAWASLARRRRLVWALWGMALVSLWLGLGNAYGLHRLALLVIPLWSKFRFTVKLALPLSLAFALLAGEGLTSLAESSVRRRALLWGLGVPAVLLSMAALVAHESLAVLTLGSVVAVGAALVLSRPELRKGWMVAALVSVELVATTQPIQRTVDDSFYAESALAKTLKEVGVGLNGPSFERLDEDSYTAEVEPYALAAAVGGHSLSFGGFFNLPDLTFYTPGASHRAHQFLSGKQTHVVTAARVYGVLGAGYLVESPELAASGNQDIVAREPWFGYAVVRQARALPRAYAVHRALAVADVEAARELIYGQAFKPGRETTIESAEAHDDWRQRPDQRAVPVEITGRTNTTVQLDATLSWPGFVVLNETMYRGWTALVDGAMRPLYIANGFVRAVEVPAGHHTIEFHYATPGLRLGVLVSGLTLLALLGFARFSRRVLLRTREVDQHSSS